MNQPLQIAIDGPVASGKGEIAARLASELHLLYIYTGAMYRALALASIQRGRSLKDEQEVLQVLHDSKLEIIEPQKNDKYPYKILLNGVDVTERITEQDAAQGASDVGTLPRVRQEMVTIQQQMAAGKRVVAEGRDIAIRVLPQAQLKIYLTASVEERARRRYKQWKEKGIAKTLDETLVDTKSRDQQDMTRSADPLQKASDAWELGTTDMTPDEVVRVIIGELERRKLI